MTSVVRARIFTLKVASAGPRSISFPPGHPVRFSPVRRRTGACPEVRRRAPPRDARPRPHRMESSMFRIINRNRGYFLILLISMILAFVKICQINNRSKAEAEICALELKEEMEKRLLEIKKLEIEKLDLKIWSLEVRTQVHNIRI